MSRDRYPADGLRRFVGELFVAAGLETDPASAMAAAFVEAELLGFSTHGLQRVPANLAWLAGGLMLYPGTLEALSPWARRFGVIMPS